MANSISKNKLQETSGEFTSNIEQRETTGKIFELIFMIGLSIGLVVLAVLVFDVFKDGLGRLFTPGFLAETPYRAWQFTLKVHKEGQAIIWSGRQELAALYRMQLSNAGLTMAFLETTESIKK